MFALPLAVALAAPAAAQDSGFEAWCRDVMSYDAARCGQAAPEDIAAYSSYRSRAAAFEAEVIARESAERALRDRVDRMGDVSPDTARDDVMGR